MFPGLENEKTACLYFGERTGRVSAEEHPGRNRGRTESHSLLLSVQPQLGARVLAATLVLGFRFMGNAELTGGWLQRLHLQALPLPSAKAMDTFPCDSLSNGDA